MTDDRQSDPDFETVRKLMESTDASARKVERFDAALDRIQAQVESLKAERDTYRDANKANLAALLTAEKAVQHSPDVDVMPAEVASLHSQMAYADPHGTYRQRHDARCYFCALLDALAAAEARAERAEAALREIAERWEAVPSDIARAALNKSENVEGGVTTGETPAPSTPSGDRCPRCRSNVRAVLNSGCFYPSNYGYDGPDPWHKSEGEG